MDVLHLDIYWNDIPVGKSNAVTYDELNALWGSNTRQTRAILHELSSYDNGDNYILIRSGQCKGFYKTDDEAEITAYKRECLNKGKSVFAPVKKINRVLNANGEQYSFDNNLRVVRESKGLSQRQVCDIMSQYITAFDKPLLSRLENGVILPTPHMLLKLAEIYAVQPFELITGELFTATAKTAI